MKRYAGLGFQSSDAWLLLAIAVAAGGKRAALSEVIGAADAINHDIIGRAEIDQGVERLQAARLIEVSPAGFAVTEEGGNLVERAARPATDRTSQLTALTVLLEAAKAPTVPPSECKGTFVSGPDYRAAEQEYRRAFAAMARKPRR